ncbi:MAG: leucine-rich repeat protein [Clostridia bacterium]|nr:leucine-rich repeat protein [Clostridia bacterium]
MPNIVIPCTRCKAPLEFRLEEAVKTCEFCEARIARPCLQAEGLVNYERAINLLHNGEFAEAAESFQTVLSLGGCNEPEAYYGRVLCHYGVQYVTDPVSGKRIPRVRIHRGKPMTELSDFQKACELAADDVRHRYEAEAAQINDTLAAFRQLVQSGSVYDAMICGGYVNGAECPGGDAEYARQLHQMLTGWGYHVFLAQSGQCTDAQIDHAMATSRLMLVICSDPERVMNPWVCSEWTGFLELSDEDASRSLIPLRYNGMRAEDLPMEFSIRGLQSPDMRRFGAESDLQMLMRHFCGDRSGKTSHPSHGEASPFSPESDFDFKNYQDGCIIDGYRGNGGDVNVPPVLGGRRVMSIGQEVFRQKHALRSICLPEGLARIGDRAFDGCSSLERVLLPASLESVGEHAFHGCTALQEFFVDGENKTLYAAHGALYSRAGELIRFPAGRRQDGALIIPDGVHRIRSGAFADCTGVTAIHLPESLEQITGDAFSGCGSLTKISVEMSNPGFRAVDGVLFSKDGKLVCYPAAAERKRYNVPSNVNRIGGYAFCGCQTLEEVVLPEELGRLSAHAFSACGALQKLEIPGAATNLEKNAVTGCLRVVLGVTSGSPAHHYAMKNNCTFVFLDHGASSGSAVPVKAQHGPVPVQLKPVPKGKRTLRPVHTTGTDREPRAVRPVTPQGEAGGMRPVMPPSEYRLTDAPGGWCVSQYTGTAEDLIIPAVLEGKRVVAVGRSAFERTQVRRVMLPETVTKLESKAFRNCKVLEALSLPASLQELAEDALDGCSALGEIKVAEKNKVFRARENVLLRRDGALVRYPAALTAEEYVVPEDVKRICRGAFADAASLWRVVLPEGLARIEEGAFRGCSALERAEIPASVTTIGADAFRDCPRAALYVDHGTAAYLWAEANGVTAVTPDPYADYVTKEEHGCWGVAGYSGPDTELTIPQEIRGGTITVVEEDAFRGNERLTKVVIPEGVTTIKKNAFFGCRRLTSISLPMSLRYIDAEALKDCPALTEIVVEEKHPHFMVWGGVLFTKSIVNGSARCAVLIRCPEALPKRKYTVPKTTKAIGAWAFSGCSHLTDLWLYEGVLNIHEGAFSGCEKLLLHVDADSFAHQWAESAGMRVELPEVIVVDPYPEFETAETDDGCEIIGYTGTAARLAIPQEIRGKRVTGVGSSAFRDMKQLSEVVVPEGVTVIGDNAFCNCTALEQISLPESLVTIAENALVRCAALKEIRVAPANPAFMVHGGALCSRDGVLICCPEAQAAASYTVPTNIHTIAAWAFSGCSKLKTINLGRVKALGNGALCGCGIRSLEVPEGVEKLPTGVLASCAELNQLILPSTLREIGPFVLQDCKALRLLDIPAGVEKIDTNAFVYSGGVKLRVTKDSYAHRCAMERKLSHELIVSEPKGKKTPVYAPEVREPKGGKTPAAEPGVREAKSEQTYAPETDFVIRKTRKGSCAIISYSGTAAQVLVPPTIRGLQVTAVHAGAFAECFSLEKITLPKGLTAIGREAFFGCSRLRNVCLPDSVAVIGSEAFKECVCLTEINLPGKLKLGRRVFAYCDALPQEIRRRSGNGVLGGLF